MNISLTFNKTELVHKCRICLLEKGIYFILALYGKDNIDIRTLYAAYTGIEINEQDDMPKSLCVDCIDGLIAVDEFIKKCKISDTVLRSLESLSTSTEPTGYKVVMIDGDSAIEFEYKDNEQQSEIIEEKIVKDELMAIELDTPESAEIVSENQSIKTETSNVTEDERVSDLQLPSTSVPENCINHEQDDQAFIQEDKSELNVLNGFDDDSLKWEESLNSDNIEEHILSDTYKDSKEIDNNVEHKTSKVFKSEKVCTVCSKSFKRNTTLKIHMYTHTHERPFSCNLCPAKFAVNGNLQRHVRIHTGERPYLCNICGKDFTQNSLKSHKLMHAGIKITKKTRLKKEKQKPILCPYCGLIFSTNRLFSNHLLNNPGHPEVTDKATLKTIPTNYCKICGKCFLNENTLKNHISIIHNGTKNFLCSYCGKNFFSKSSLTTHTNTHTGVRPYKCEYCHKTFSQIHSLVCHRYTHTGERPYSCKVCDKSFKQLSHLNYHSVLHTNERKHSCIYCGKKFKLRINLKQHLVTHTNEKPYHCSYCNRSFNASNNMKKHLQIHERQKLK